MQSVELGLGNNNRSVTLTLISTLKSSAKPKMQGELSSVNTSKTLSALKFESWVVLYALFTLKGHRG